MDIIGEKTEYKKIFNYFLKLLYVVGPNPPGTRYCVYNLKLLNLQCRCYFKNK